LIKDIDIRSLANDASYTRGCRYYENGAVMHLQKKQFEDGYTAKVHGNSLYGVDIELMGDRVKSYACECPAADLYPGACKHVVAVLKAIQHEQRLDSEGRQRAGSGMRLFELFAAGNTMADEAAGDPVVLEPKLCVSFEYSHQTNWLELRIGRDKFYVVRNILEFLHSMRDGLPMSFGKGLMLDPSRLCFAPGISEQLWALLQDTYRDEQNMHAYSSYFRSSYSAGSAVFEQKRFKLSPSNLSRFMDIMGDHSFTLVLNELEELSTHVEDGNPSLDIEVADRSGAGRIVLQTEGVTVLDEAARYVYAEPVIYRVTPEFSRVMRPLGQAFSRTRSLKIDAAHMGDFFAEVLPQMEKAATVHVAPSFSDRFEIMPLTAEIYLDYYKEGIAARLVFRYANIAFNPVAETAPDKTDRPGESKRLIRDAQTEHQILQWFRKFHFTTEKDQLVQPDEEKTYDFLTEALPHLSEMADVFYSEIFNKKPVQMMPRVTVGVSVNADHLLEVSFANQNFDFDELIELLGSYRLKRRYHRLKDGTFVSLGEQQLGALADFVESAGIRKGEDGKAIVPLAKAMYIDALAQEDEGLRLERSHEFKTLVREIKNPGDVDVTVPEELRGVLRDYQVTGFAWLSTLAAYGLGGILADDMGLGKTLEVIAFLLAHREEQAPPALVVTPTSLMYNWIDEIERFAPDLKADAIAGTKKEREAKLQADGNLDVVITTYNMLKRDIDLYAKQTFRYCFLDEAQHIKNPTTQNARAVKCLKTGGYFALTGTPIENTLTELWSIFDFLMPGYLATHKMFKQRFEVPIVRAQDAHALKNLSRHIKPFILRRMKKDVLTELPDKVESKMVNEMTPKQAKVYAAYFVQGQKEFREELKAHGFDASHIKILAILTRLRQIACDPSLFLEDYDGGSGKLDMLEEVVQEATAGGHRLLIFSQFTTMLHHIGERLEGLDMEYEYLDGQTPALERIRLVKEFNAGSTPVFLISLKAGGTGLNLTGADMVVHYDPWWNPAVEDQATDRAYRIGQRNNVQVLKFITKDTIEEKIFALQERKKALIDQMIRPGENFLTKLTETEIMELFR
jgi:SNF2 family DNA or RNA helicase